MKKKKNMKINIIVDPLSVPDKDHLRAQIKFPALVVESKKHKKPKYKEKYFEDFD